MIASGETSESRPPIFVTSHPGQPLPALHSIKHHMKIDVVAAVNHLVHQERLSISGNGRFRSVSGADCVFVTYDTIIVRVLFFCDVSSSGV